MPRPTKDSEDFEEEEGSSAILARAIQKKRLDIFNALKLGSQLREEAESGSMTAFIIPLIITLAKDLVDIFGITAPSILLGLPATLVVIIFIWGTGTWKVGLVKFVIIFAGLVDSIPIVALLPWQTLSVLHAMHVFKQQREKKNTQADDIEKYAKAATRTLKQAYQKFLRVRKSESSHPTRENREEQPLSTPQQPGAFSRPSIPNTPTRQPGAFTRPANAETSERQPGAFTRPPLPSLPARQPGAFTRPQPQSLSGKKRVIPIKDISKAA